ncbi:low affinity iron permease family protein, partial [Pseudomonas syringae pv. tagetis]|uniref:low affinity iron permease family protein n=1 Tax=Pseudomonas syringae group genomosp. 7 TaxID=251699 RepID=UPI00377038A3
ASFASAVVLIFLWAVNCQWFHYYDCWQLLINTSTTIITFIMVFLIKNTQNSYNDVLHLKLDELLSETKDAQNSMLNLDDLTK